MTPNINRITSLLAQMSVDELNAILDNRDSPGFETAYLPLQEKYFNPAVRHPEAESLFIQISQATRQHELTSYIADDLDLITAYEATGERDPAMDEIIKCYEFGDIPGRPAAQHL